MALRRRLLQRLLLLLILTLPAGSAAAQSCEPVVVGSIGGATRDIAIVEDRAYILKGENLLVFDVADPSNPIERGSVRITHSLYAVAAQGDTAFVGSADGVHVLDVHDPEHPFIIAHVDTSGGAADVALDGSTLLVADNAAGLLFIDVSDPQDPQTIAIPGFPDVPVKIVIRDSIAFVAEYYDGISIIDVSTPSAPSILSSVALADGALLLDLSGDLLVAGDQTPGGDGLSIIDISDLTEPEIVTTTLQENVYGIAITGATAIVRTFYNLLLVDLSEPASPIVRKSERTVTSGTNMVIAGDLLYATGGATAMEVVDLADLIAPAVFGVAPLAEPATDLSEVIIDSDRGYATTKHGLTVLDVSDPQFPDALGSVELSGRQSGLTVHGGLAFVTSDSGLNLSIVDTADPTQPSILGSVLIPGLPVDVAVSGKYALVATLINPLAVIDVHDPANPVGVLQTGDPPYGTRVIASGNFAVTADNDTLSIVDITVPSHVNVLAEVPMPTSGPQALAVRDNVLYLATIEGGLHLYDVSDPTTPVHLNSLTDLGPIRDLAFLGELTLLPYRDGVHVFDLRTPSDPTQLADLQLEMVNVSTDGEFAYFLENCCTASVQVLDVDDEQDPPTIAIVESLGKSGILTVRDNVVYAAEEWSELDGLKIIDVSDATHPRVLSAVDTQDRPRGIAEEDGRIYVTDRSRLIVLDVTDPTMPITLGSAEVPTGRLAVHEQFAYVSDLDGLHIIDAHDPGSIAVLATLPLPDYPLSVVVRQGVAYVLSSQEELLLFDVADPAHPAELATLPMPHARRMTVTGSTAYISAKSPDGSTLAIVDVSDPANPAVIGQASTTGLAYAIDVQAGKAYITRGTGGVEIVDVTVPQHPGVVGTFDTSGQALDIEVHNGVAYVADDERGLQLFDVSTCAVDPACLADLTDDGPPGVPDGTIDVFDLYILLLRWGLDGPGADIAPPNDRVDVFDVLELLQSWGPCN